MPARFPMSVMQLVSAMAKPEIRGVGVVRDAQGRIKVDPDFDVSKLPDDARCEAEAITQESR